MTAQQIIDKLSEITVIDSILCMIMVITAIIITVTICLYGKNKFKISFLIISLGMIAVIPLCSLHKYMIYKNMEVETLVYDNITGFKNEGKNLVFVCNDKTYMLASNHTNIIVGQENQVFEWKKKGETQLWWKIYLKEEKN